MNTKDLIEWLVETGEDSLPAPVELIRAAYGERASKEYEAREVMVRDAVRAKRELGLRGKELNASFFRDIWPKARDALISK
jgi:hypothetical protein